MNNVDPDLKLGELIDAYVPKEKLPADLNNNVRQLQAALLIAHETGVDEGKSVFNRIRPLDKVIDDLTAAGLADAGNVVADAASNRIGKETLMAFVPSYGMIATSKDSGFPGISQKVKDALMGAQVAARITALVDENRSFPEARIFDNDPAFLQSASKVFNSLVNAKETGIEISAQDKKIGLDQAQRARAGANEFWEDEFGVSLFTQEEIIGRRPTSPDNGLKPGPQ